MKILTSLHSLRILMVFVSMFFVNCTDPALDTVPALLIANQKDNSWVSFLEDRFYESSVIVTRDGSIQEAVNQAQAGDAIYIEPGTYRENVIVNKPDIKLIGLTYNNEKVFIEPPGIGQNSITTQNGISDLEISNIEFTKGDNKYSAGRERSNARKSNGNFKIIRKDLGQKIAHYEFEVRVGARPYDVIKIHRVVRESRAFRPIRTQGNVFMLHGAALKFESVFLRPGVDNPTPQTSSAFYLASKNIDVWGMDFGWTRVPLQTSDFTFMKDWGVGRDVDHALAGMAVARLIRGLTWQGLDRMNLLGYSYGVAVAYAAAGRETVQHPILRDVKGIVAVDQVMKYAPADDASRQSICNAAATIKSRIDNGEYQSSSGAGFSQFGTRALTSPNDPSPVNPNFTNAQFALFIITSTFAIDDPPAPFWHFAGGKFEGGLPTGLLYSDQTRWFKLMKSLPPFQPQRTIYESRLCLCNEEDVIIDDNLGKISVPILYIGAGGAFGTLGDYTSSLTSSNDITNYTVTLTNERVTDFGHGDLFLGNDADDLVWKQLYQWLVRHHGYISVTN